MKGPLDQWKQSLAVMENRGAGGTPHQDGASQDGSSHMEDASGCPNCKATATSGAVVRMQNGRTLCSVKPSLFCLTQQSCF